MGRINVSEINYQLIKYYSAPKKKKKLNSLDEVDPEILETFEKLGISLNEQKDYQMWQWMQYLIVFQFLQHLKKNC